MKSFFPITVALLALVLVQTVIAQDWNQWRGPARDGSVATGALRWATEGREGEHASMLLTPCHVVYLTNGADLIVAQRGAATFKVEKRYDVADAETWAVPVLLGPDILVRDATGLMRLTAGQ
jgi:hypothetical protein